MDIDPKRTLQYRFPEIAKEWHPTLNYPLTPKNITYGSNKKVWWQCPEVKDHIYDAIICDRTNKKKRVGCSFCRGNMRVSPERSLATLSPEIAKEWHPTLNAPLTPKDIFNGSSKIVWWQCPKNEDHTYEAVVNSRTGRNKNGCSYCGGNMRVSPERSLATLSPEIAKEWHPTLNAPLTPKDVFNSSHQKVWWQCPKNKEHVWDARILDRTRNDKRRSKGCRICR